MTDEKPKIAKCLKDFDADERKVLVGFMVSRAERCKEDSVKEFKRSREREGREFTSEDETRIRKSWDDWTAKGCPNTRNVTINPRPSPEKMHEEILAAGWTYEGLRKVRRPAKFGIGPVEIIELPFYWSPTKKLGAFQFQAWRVVKDGNKFLGGGV